MWGGIHVWNPPTCSMNSDGNHSSMNKISSEVGHILCNFIVELFLLFFIIHGKKFVLIFHVGIIFFSSGSENV